MQFDFLTFLIVCPLVFAAGFVDAIAGGGGIISLPAFMIAGLPVHNALGTNKLAASFGATVSAVRYGMQGYIKYAQVLPAVVFAYAGSSLGSKCALLIDERIFKFIMLAVIPATAAFLLFRKKIFDEKEPFTVPKTVLISCIASLTIGFYDGIYGPGTGTFLILLFTNAAHMKLTEANGAAKAINLTTNIASLIVYLLNGVVIFPLGLTAGCFNLVGSYLGTKCFDKGGAKTVRPIMLVVMALFFVKIITELITG